MECYVKFYYKIFNENGLILNMKMNLRKYGKSMIAYSLDSWIYVFTEILSLKIVMVDSTIIMKLAALLLGAYKTNCAFWCGYMLKKLSPDLHLGSIYSFAERKINNHHWFLTKDRLDPECKFGEFHPPGQLLFLFLQPSFQMDNQYFPKSW